MDFAFNEEQRMLRDTIRRMVRRELEPLLARYPKDKPLPKEALLEAMRIVQPLGFLGARVPPEAGGAGLDHVCYGVLLEETPPVLSLSFMATEATTTRIFLGGCESLKQRLLPPLLAGEKIASTATSEPNVGSDPGGIETKATLVGDEYVINGTKLWATNGSIADILMAVVSLGRDERGQNILGRLVVERDVSPFQTRDIETIGLRQGHLCEVIFDDCRVAQENLVGTPGDTHRVMTRTWLTHRVANALWGLHVAQRALDASITYAKQRKQFGKVIGSFQLVQSMLAEMATLIEASRLLCYKALWLLDQGVWAAKETSMAKCFGAETALRVTSMAMELHGAYGTATELPLEQYYRDARMFTFPDGTTEINKLIVGRELVGIRAFA